MMARLPTSGSAIVTPCRDEAELRAVLCEIGLGSAVDKDTVSKVHQDLGGVIGRWWQEAERLDASILIKMLASGARNLRYVVKLVEATEGFQTSQDLESALLIKRYLAREEDIGSDKKALELMSDFRTKAAKVASACDGAVVELRNLTGRGGRPKLDWYDDFTGLLLGLAKKGNVSPILRKDRVTGERSGWLLEAALALETFLEPRMRSQSTEACGKRLERSKRRLTGRVRQNPATP